MASIINKKTLEHLAELSRIEISGKKDKLLKDLKGILGYFEELKELNTENVEPMAGGTIEKNVFREDGVSIRPQKPSAQLTGQFPEEESNYLKIPPVFE